MQVPGMKLGIEGDLRVRRRTRLHRNARFWVSDVWGLEEHIVVGKSSAQVANQAEHHQVAT
jgi:hypothetical protein